MKLSGEHRDAAAPLISKATAPRSWQAMLDAWSSLLASLCAVLGPSSPLQERGGEPIARLAPVPRWVRVWEMMWALPPCSEARKAAFTLGAAALLIERWRRRGDAIVPRAGQDAMDAVREEHVIGQRAESLLRIAVWHIDDARGEQHARTLGHEPTIPPHERVYHRTADGLVFVSMPGVAFGVPWTPAILAHAILEDHGGHTRIEQRRLWSDEHMFAELCIASLPDGPWVMTTRDVERFLELVLEVSKTAERMPRCGLKHEAFADMACEREKGHGGEHCPIDNCTRHPDDK